jgi:hypothetical protein
MLRNITQGLGLGRILWIIIMIKSRRMRWVWRVALMEAKRNAYRILVGKPEGKRPLGRPRRRGRINLKWTSEEYDGVVWTGSGSGYGSVEGFCEHGSEPSSSMNCWEILV